MIRTKHSQSAHTGRAKGGARAGLLLPAHCSHGADGPLQLQRRLPYGAHLHRFLTVCWVPFVALHVLAMMLDAVARIGPLDLVIPFRVSYAALPIGLGTIGFDLLLIVTVTGYLRGHLDPAAWRWLHRLSYVMFGVFLWHALLAGTDFARPVVLAPAAAVVAFIAITSLARLVFGRLKTTSG